jgi:hypothetical protein
MMVGAVTERVEQRRDGWVVFDEDEAELGEIGNFGVVAAGFPDEAKAQAWLEDYRLEKQLREWEAHVYSECDEIPF